MKISRRTGAAIQVAFWAAIALPLAAAAQSTTPPPQPAPKHGMQLPVRAKTHEEYVAYQAAVANLANPDAMAKAADDFAAKFPDSDLRELLYRKLMKSCQKAGDEDKTLQAGLKVLAIDKDDPEALLGVAEIQEEHTTAMDLDREQRMQQALANASRALQTIDTDLTIPAGVDAQRLQAYKQYLRAAALAIVGGIEYKRQQYPEAEKTFRSSIEADPGNPDPVVLLRLALVLDQEKKYDDALQQANHAVELTKEDSQAGKVARTEQKRLAALVAPSSAPSTAQPAAAEDGSAPANGPAAPAH